MPRRRHLLLSGTGRYMDGSYDYQKDMMNFADSAYLCQNAYAWELVCVNIVACCAARKIDRLTEKK